MAYPKLKCAYLGSEYGSSNSIMVSWHICCTLMLLRYVRSVGLYSVAHYENEGARIERLQTAKALH
jgi:hypothetical protein